MKRLIINICITLVTIMLVVLLWELKDKYEIVEYILNNNLIMYGGILIIVFIICYSIKWYKRKKNMNIQQK